jgi:hypothetical protein
MLDGRVNLVRNARTWPGLIGLGCVEACPLTGVGGPTQQICNSSLAPHARSPQESEGLKGIFRGIGLSASLFARAI